MTDSITCKSRASANAALETIAANLPRGTQRAAFLAVKDWINENYPKDFDEETRARLQRIYDDTFDDAGWKAIEWQVHGGEPPSGTRAEVPFLFNAETKTWELETEMPPVWTEPNPNILPKTEGYEDDDEI
ncbi:MAG: hypothetical protein LBK27_08460 [Treponema sp.]|jgi:hypothetical protein|nr:hypothetical protein [Treponema sp.]